MKQQQVNKIGATPGKLALVGVLAVVLVLVIVKQRTTGDAPINLSSKRATAASRKALAEKNQENTTSAKRDSRPQEAIRAWPTNGLATALANDPFEMPVWKDRPEALTNSNTAGELASLQQQGTSIVVIGTAEKSATIGEQRVQVGDILDGYEITDITDKGIVLDKL